MDIEMGECILRILALNICMLGNFVCFFIVKNNFFKKFLQKYYQSIFKQFGVCRA